MKILGINISHNSSSCLLEDGKILYYIEDERLNRINKFTPTANNYHELLNKTYEVPFIGKLKSYTNHVDYIIFSSYVTGDGNGVCLDTVVIESYLESFKRNGITFGDVIFENNHHIYHAANGFYASGFDDAVCLIMDSGGAIYKNLLFGSLKLREHESFFDFSYDSHPNKLKQVWSLHSHLNKNIQSNLNSREIDFLYDSEFVTKVENDVLCSTYSNGGLFKQFCALTGFKDGENDSGKVMGLSSYTKKSLPKAECEEFDWFKEVNGEWITSTKIKEYIGDHITGRKQLPFDVKSFDGNNLHSKANLSNKLQNETLKHTNRLIKQALELSSSRNIVLSGGYALNCVNNYKYLNNLPKDVKLFVDPISGDAGTAIGAAKLLWYQLSGSKEKHKLESLYLG